MSVVASVFFGFILLVAVTRALPAEPVWDLYIVPTSWVAAMGQSWGTFILFICCVAQFFCLTASVTSASRMLFAFRATAPSRHSSGAASRGTACRTWPSSRSSWRRPR